MRFMFKRSLTLLTLIVISVTITGCSNSNNIKPKGISKPILIEEPFYKRVAPLGRLISKGEGDYNSVNRGWAGDTPGGIVSITGKPFAQYTIGQVLSMQNGGIYAVGRYQFIPMTLRWAIKKSGLSHNSKFCNETQDKLFAILLLHKRPSVSGYINGDHDSVTVAADEMSKEWASIEYRNGRSYYSGIGGNGVHISRSEIISTLNTIRSNQ